MMPLFGKAEEEFLDMIARFTSNLGLGEAAGKIWGTLLLVNIPLSQSDISQLTKYSLGIVSMNLSLLERWGLVKKVGRVGKRKVYAATSTIVDLLENFLHRIIDKELSPVISYLQNNIDSFDDSTKRNALKLLGEYKKARLLLKFAIITTKKLRVFSTRELSKIFKLMV
ncbi:MAG: hypothetical protein DRJ39_02840 [Thermoprotei archaeon]|nr:MAG: hypothetical protein DRJ39_02840 [Thermoprotei archaeon]